MSVTVGPYPLVQLQDRRCRELMCHAHVVRLHFSLEEEDSGHRSIRAHALRTRTDLATQCPKHNIWTRMFLADSLEEVPWMLG